MIKPGMKLRNISLSIHKSHKKHKSFYTDYEERAIGAHESPKFILKNVAIYPVFITIDT